MDPRLTALLCAFSAAVADCLTKKCLSNVNIYIVYWVRIGYTIPVLLIWGNLFPFPDLPMGFWLIMIPQVLLESSAGLLYARAIQVSPLSMCIPFMAFTPVFLLLVGYLVLGEIPSVMGCVGVVFVAVGAYMLNLHRTKNGFFDPIKAVFREPGSRMMLMVAVIYTFSASFGKKALSYTTPEFFGIFYMLLVAIVCFPVMLVLSGGKIKAFVAKPVVFLLVGTAMGFMIITHFVAVERMPVAYMIATKRMNLLFSVFFGHWLFREERLIQNALACIIMVLGVFIVAVS